MESVIGLLFRNFLISLCPKTQVSDEKTLFSRLAKQGNPQFTIVNEEFSCERNEGNGVFLQTLINKNKLNRLIRGKSNLICLLIFFICSCNLLFSQDYSIFNRNYLNPFIVNPAVTGIDYYPTSSISAEKYLFGIENSPSTYQFTGTIRLGEYGFYNPKGLVNKGPIKYTDRIGLGVALFQDNNGPLINTGGSLSYAYHLPVGVNSQLSFGMTFMLVNYNINSTMFDPDDYNDSHLLENQNALRFNMGFGVFYKNKHFFAGLSSTKLLPGIDNLNDELAMKPGLFAIAGYQYILPQRKFVIEPSVNIKMADTDDILLDIHSKVYLINLNWIAISYSNFNRIDLQFGLRLYKSLYLGYSYGYTTGEISNYTQGAHQISLGINLGLYNRIVFDNIFSSSDK